MQIVKPDNVANMSSAWKRPKQSNTWFDRDDDETTLKSALDEYFEGDPAEEKSTPRHILAIGLGESFDSRKHKPKDVISKLQGYRKAARENTRMIAERHPRINREALKELYNPLAHVKWGNHQVDEQEPWKDSSKETKKLLAPEELDTVRKATVNVLKAGTPLYKDHSFFFDTAPGELHDDHWDEFVGSHFADES